jgi:hypothetical protein
MHPKKISLIIFAVMTIFTACTKTTEIDNIQQIVGHL